MSFLIEVLVQCEECGRHEIVYRGEQVSRAQARRNAKRAGWSWDMKADVHTCPECIKKSQFTLDEETENEPA